MPIDKQQTAMQELIDHIKTDVQLNMTTQKAGDRIIWYIETYFLGKEKQQIISGFDKGFKEGWEYDTIGNEHENGLDYFTQTFHTPKQGS